MNLNFHSIHQRNNRENGNLKERKWRKDVKQIASYSSNCMHGKSEFFISPEKKGEMEAKIFMIN